MMDSRAIDPLYGTSLRQPPSNMMAEQALLGALLANNGAYERVSEFLAPEHFADPINGRTYKIIARRIEAGQLADSVTLKTEFENSGVFDEVGGGAYLARLNASMVGIINAGEYGQTVYDCWIRRRLIAIGEDTVNDAFASFDDGIDQVEKAENALFALADKGMDASAGPVTLASAIQTAMDEGRLHAQGKGDTYRSTGLPSLDKAIIGLGAGHLLVVAGRPGMGKTSLAKNISLHLALRDEPTPVAYFQLEETVSDFGASAMAMMADVEVSSILTGALLTAEEEARVVKAQGRAANAPILLEERPRQSLRQIAMACKKIKRKHPDLGLVVVDFLQLMADVPGFDKRLSVGSNIYGLKALAKQLRCTVIALAQLSRAVELMPDKRPNMSHLRETSEIEDAADVILLLFREEFYHRQTVAKRDGDDPPDAMSLAQTEWNEKLAKVEGRAEFMLPKIRRAAPTVLHMHYDGPHLKFGEPRQ